MNGTLMTVGGFCQGRKDVPGKESVYPRGFLRQAWGLDLSAPEAGWYELPDLPGHARQELCAIVVGDRLCCCGGFSYDAPHCYRDGYRWPGLRGSSANWNAGTHRLSGESVCVLGHCSPHTDETPLAWVSELRTQVW